MGELARRLEDARAEVIRLEREAAFATCVELGHDWRSHGGANAGCGDACCCSVPVNVCARCGDSDYGKNSDADDVRQDCFDRGISAAIPTEDR